MNNVYFLSEHTLSLDPLSEAWFSLCARQGADAMVTLDNGPPWSRWRYWQTSCCRWSTQHTPTATNLPEHHNEH